MLGPVPPCSLLAFSHVPGVDVCFKVVQFVTVSLPRREQGWKVIQKWQCVNDPRPYSRSEEEALHDLRNLLGLVLVAALQPLAIRQRVDGTTRIPMEARREVVRCQQLKDHLLALEVLQHRVRLAHAHVEETGLQPLVGAPLLPVRHE